jgi:hypothetical protein
MKTIGVGYCKTCKDTGVIDNPKQHYPKCGKCERYHAID